MSNMGILGTSNKTVLGAVQQQSDQQFKNVNNLLSLQDNHVEEFFQYHGQMFLTQMAKPSSINSMPTLPLPVLIVSYENISKLFSTTIPLSPSFLSMLALPSCRATSPILAKAPLHLKNIKRNNIKINHLGMFILISLDYINVVIVS